MTARLLFVVSMIVAGTSVAQAQSLAEVAKAEQDRRKAVQAPSKVYTNDDLRPDFTRPAPPASPEAEEAPADPAAEPATPPAADAAAAPAAAAPSAGGPPRDEAYWSARITEARAQVERSRAFAEAIQNRIDMLWTDFVNRDDPAQRAVIETERNRALAELERLRLEIDAQTKAVAAIEDEARREGVPAGWLRPPV